MPTARNIHELEALLVSSEEDNGIDHVDTVEIRHKLAHRYRAIQNFDKAIILFKRNISTSEKSLGPTHMITLRRRSSLANCLYAAGRYEEAIPNFTSILLDRSRSLGPYHPDSLRTQGSLANCYRAIGNLEKSLRLHNENLRLRRRVLRSQDLNTIASAKNVSFTKHLMHTNDQ